MTDSNGADQQGPKRVDTEDLMNIQPIRNYIGDHEITEEDYAIIREHFDHFDRDNSETIHADNLKELFAELGIETELSAHELIAVVDKDYDSALSWAEFKVLIRKVRERAMQAREEAKRQQQLATLRETGGDDADDEDADNESKDDEATRRERERERLRLEAIDKAAPAGVRRYTTWCCMGLFFFTYVDVGMMPVLADVFRDELKLGPDELGLLPLAYMLGFALFTWLIAIFANKATTYTWVMLFLVLNALSLGFTGIANNFGLLMLMRFLTGVSNCVFGIFMFPLLYALEPQNPLVWNGLANAMIPLALGFGYIVSGVLIDAGVSWEVLFIGLGVLISINVVLLGVRPGGFAAVEAAKSFQIRRKPTYKQQWRVLYCNAFNVVTLIVAGQFYVVISAIQFWIVIFYIDVAKVSDAEAALVSGGLMVSSAVLGSLIGAVVMAKLDTGVRGTMLYFMVLSVVCALGLAVFLYMEDSKYIYPATALTFMSLTAHLPLINDIPLKVLPAAFQDFGASRLSLVQGAFGAAGPAIAGVLIDIWSLQTMFGLLIVSCGLIFVFSFIGYLLYPTELEQKQKTHQALGVWAMLLDVVGHQTNSAFGYNHTAHIEYERFYQLTHKFTPRNDAEMAAAHKPMATSVPASSSVRVIHHTPGYVHEEHSDDSDGPPPALPAEDDNTA